jgi:hypothetical protein
MEGQAHSANWARESVRPWLRQQNREDAKPTLSTDRQRDPVRLDPHVAEQPNVQIHRARSTCAIAVRRL